MIKAIDVAAAPIRQLAADQGSGADDPRASADDLLRRALGCLSRRAREGGRVAMRADAGYLAGQLARAAHVEHVAFGEREALACGGCCSATLTDWTGACIRRDAGRSVRDVVRICRCESGSRHATDRTG